MTIITALNDGQDTWLGYNDSLTIGDTIIQSTLNPWLRFNDWALGISGEPAQQNVLEHKKKNLLEAGNEPLGVIEAMRDIFSEYNHSVDEVDEAAPSYGIWCILAHKNGGIWDVASRLAITQIPENMLWARGSGTDYALGADSALQGLSLCAEERITKATQAAIDCDLYCPGAIRILKL
jgi:ATP-dependent protease HslVU (ClpYQ) peptidase subunit